MIRNPRYRVRRQPNYRAIWETLWKAGGAQASSPQIEPGRVVSDPDGLPMWDPRLGWLVEVEMTAPEFPQEGIMCRWASMYQGTLGADVMPPQPGCAVLVSFPSGDPNATPTIVAAQHDIQCPAPSTVNGETITERDAPEGEVDASVSWISAMPLVRREAQFSRYRLVAPEGILLAATNPTQPYVRGIDKANADEAIWDAFNTLLDAINAAITSASATTAGGVVIDPLSITTFRQALTQFGAARQTYLSQLIRGE